MSQQQISIDLNTMKELYSRQATDANNVLNLLAGIDQLGKENMTLKATLTEKENEISELTKDNKELRAGIVPARS